MANGTVSLGQEVRGPGMSMMMGGASATTRPDGSWRLVNVAPGEYRITASGVADGSRESVNQLITVDGQDVEGLTLIAGANATITGQVVTEPEAKTPLVLTRLRVANRTDDLRPQPMSANSGTVDQQGNFQLEGAVGKQRIIISGLPDGWALKSIEREGVDLTDDDIDLRSSERLDNLRITLTDRLTVVRGLVLDDRKEPTSSGTVVVFAEDARLLGENSRFVRGVRPSQTGEFEVKGLPPGSYRAAALEYILEGDWNDPDVLASLRDRANRFILTEGETRTLDLALSK